MSSINNFERFLENDLVCIKRDRIPIFRKFKHKQPKLYKKYNFVLSHQILVSISENSSVKYN